MRRAGLGLCVWPLLVFGCQNTDAAKAQALQETKSAAIEAVRTDQAQKASAEKERLTSNPTKYIKATEFGVADKGIINHYRQLTKITVLNTSHFAVQGLRGLVDWSDAKGNLIGSTAISLAGSIPAGATKTFTTADGSMQSGTLQGAATSQAVRFTSASVVESE